MRRQENHYLSPGAPLSLDYYSNHQRYLRVYPGVNNGAPNPYTPFPPTFFAYPHCTPNGLIGRTAQQQPQVRPPAFPSSSSFYAQVPIINVHVRSHVQL